MKGKFIIWLLLFCITLSGCAESQNDPESDSEQLIMTEGQNNMPAVNAVELSEVNTFLESVLGGEYDKAYGMCNDEMKTFFESGEKMGSMWEEILVSVGVYHSRVQSSAAQTDEVMVYTYQAQFETGAYNINISISPEGQIAGFNIWPAASNNQNARAKQEGPTASADLPEGLAEKDIIVNKGQEHELYGKLTYPADTSGPIPAVVLVHGSGAHNMDEAITAENKPFRDIAYFLPLKGIAVFRYHKVTYAYPEDFDQATLTIDTETVNDAVAAKQALLEQADMNFSDIYVAGHSLGGIMAPRIAKEGGYDGMILMAGSPRSMIDILYDQNHYMISVSGLPQDQIDDTMAETDRLYAEAKEIMQLSPAEMEGKTVFGSFSAAYFYSASTPSVAEVIRELDLPMLILQGSKDFQVYADRDFAQYKDITQGLSDVTMIEYDGLNHMFMPSFMERPDLSEYKTPAKVDTKVLEDIAEWIGR